MVESVVLFAGNVGVFPNIDTGLWETNGTGTGTFQLTPVAGANASLSPSNLTLLNNQVLFSGLNSAGHDGLWTTNGSAAGTKEITGIAGVSASGLNPGRADSLPK